MTPLAIALAATAIICLVGAGVVVRLSIKGRLALGNWDIPIAMLFVVLSIALAATAGAAWRSPPWLG